MCSPGWGNLVAIDWNDLPHPMPFLPPPHPPAGSIWKPFYQRLRFWVVLTVRVRLKILKLIERLPNGSNDPPLRMTHPFFYSFKTDQAIPPPLPPPPKKKKNSSDPAQTINTDWSLISMMKTCFPRSKRRGQHLTENRETNDKRNPLYKDSHSSFHHNFIHDSVKHIKFYNNDWKKKDLAKINKISNDFMMILLVNWHHSACRKLHNTRNKIVSLKFASKDLALITRTILPWLTLKYLFNTFYNLTLFKISTDYNYISHSKDG